MEKLPMCRICLGENVSMYIVVNKNLHKLYEKLTDIPFVTEDSRPMLACFFCCAKLKQCYQLLRKCLEAEELFAQMMNEDYEPKLLNQGQEFYNGFIQSTIVHINIDDEFQTKSIAIKEELPDVCERLDDIIEPKEEHQSDELEPENLDNSCLNVADIPPYHSESDLEDDVPLMEFKIEVKEEQDASENEQRASETTRAAVAKKPKLEDAITAEQPNEEKFDSKIIRTTQKHTSKPGTYFKEPYKCDQRSFNRVKVSKRLYKCDVCQRSFTGKTNLSLHIRTHTGEKPYKCDVCQRSFSVKYGLLRHIRIHTSEKPYKCDVCQSSFSEKGVLLKHIRVHTGEKPFKCELCESSFRQLSHLKRHNLVHTAEKPFKCDVCQRSFSAKGNLSKHIRIHTGGKPKRHKCDICQRCFDQKNYLAEHIHIHTGEKPYKCNLCQRSFSQKGYLTKHIRIHTGVKPYKCDICKRDFGKKSTLTRHIRIHTGEKPFKCDICEHSFRRNCLLTNHIRKHHTGEKPCKRNGA